MWNETKTLTVTKGLFSTSLGDQKAFGDSVKFDNQYWLGIKINSEVEISPRIKLNSSAYSFTSIISDTTKNIVDGKVVKSINTLKDNITIKGSGGTTINTTGNIITISSSGTGGTGIQGVQNTNNTIDVINPNGPTATVNLKLPLNLNGSADGSNYLFSANNSSSGHGILGVSVLGYGSVGIATGTTGQTIGVVGNSLSPDGYAISGWNLATTGSSIGILGKTSSPIGIGIRGTGGANGWGVLGESSGGWGVYGNSSTGAGVVGISNVWAGVYGETSTWFGIWGKATGDNGKGVFGESANSYGVWGKSLNSAGVVGESDNWVGVFGESNTGNAVVGSSAKGIGVYGTTAGVGQFSVYGKHNSSTSTYGALGYYNYLLPFSFEYGVYGASSSENGLAAYFVGGVGVTGNFSVTGNKTFKIDHPLDPLNKYLIHSCVESPDRMNIYNGNIVTDGTGLATVELPEYFETLNIDYHYQLTVIGQFAQAIIESKIQNNRFTIRTDKPNVEISWQVTGVRNDEYAKQHPFIVEQEKETFAKGKYLMPELFGQPEEKGINYVKKPEIVKRNDGSVE